MSVMLQMWSWTFLLAVIALLPFTNCQLRISLSRQEISQDLKNEKPAGSLQLLGLPALLKNYQNVYYVGEIKLGTPGDKLRVVFDTGSPSFWVYSGSGWNSWTCLPCWFHKTYHHSRSSTYTPIGKPVEINYVSGYMKGYSSQDVLRIGNLTVPVMLAEATSAPFWSSLTEKFDGILGLAPCAGLKCPLYRTLTDPVIHSVLPQLPAPVFSVYLDRSGKTGGEITFGGTNEDLYVEGSLKMHSTSKQYAWTLAIESVWVGEKMVANYSRRAVDAYIDTGTSLIVGPPLDITKILKEMGIPYGLQVSCSSIKDLPSLSFVIGGEKYTLSSKDYASVRTKPLFGSEICYHGLQGMFLSTNSWILGDVFLGKFYSVFEVENEMASKIGFAKLKVKS